MLFSPLAARRPLWSSSTVDGEQQKLMHADVAPVDRVPPAESTQPSPSEPSVLSVDLVGFVGAVLSRPPPALSCIVLSSALMETKWRLGWCLQGRCTILFIKEERCAGTDPPPSLVTQTDSGVNVGQGTNHESDFHLNQKTSPLEFSCSQIWK